MAAQPPQSLTIVWEPEARKDWTGILDFFIERNGSIDYSLKLDDQLMHSLELLCTQPEMGEQTDIENVRCHIVENYAVLYRIRNKTLEVAAIIDARQDRQLD